MRYVILRDDDTNALTPVDCLERLYRPFLDRGLPVNLATIPNVRTDTVERTGRPEGYLAGRDHFSGPLRQNQISETPNPGESSLSSATAVEQTSATTHVSIQPDAPRILTTEPALATVSRSFPGQRNAAFALQWEAADSRNRNEAPSGFLPLTVPIGANDKLVQYLRDNRDLHIVQHGLHHSVFEFDSPNGEDIRRRLDQGTRLLVEAGFPRPETFVAPYDRLSRASLRQVATRFRVLSTGWFERRRLPVSWWPAYALKKLFRREHWRIGRTLLLTHPGCLLSYHRPYDMMFEQVRKSVTSRRLTVLVTHWWEYFRAQRPDEALISILHEVADWLSCRQDVKVISFSELAEGTVPLH